MEQREREFKNAMEAVQKARIDATVAKSHAVIYRDTLQHPMTVRVNPGRWRSVVLTRKND